LVLAGFPTTTTLQFLLAKLFIAFPCYLKIRAFSPSKSFLFIPGFLGLDPAKIAN
jgi:hypothetical protein